MRSTAAIVDSLKGKKPVTEQEMAMALLVQSSVIYFYEKELKGCVENKHKAVLEKIHPQFSTQAFIDRMHEALRADPLQYLGGHIPGNPNFDKLYAFGKKLIDKFAPKDEEGGE